MFDEAMDVDDTSFYRKCNRLSLSSSDDFVELKSAFKGILKTFFLKNTSEKVKDICLLLNRSKFKIKRLLNDLLSRYGGLKFNIVVECTYIKQFTNELQDRAFKTSNLSVFQSSPINNILKNLFDKICLEESEYQGKGSGWTLHCIDGILLRFSKYTPLGGSSYLPLPLKIQLKKAVVNPKNFQDNKCFQWAILSRYTSNKNKHSRIDHEYLQLVDTFNFKNIPYPTPIKSIKRFEKDNPGVSVNVYGLTDKDVVYPLRISANELANHFDLLLMTGEEEGTSHYCYIKNFSRLLSSSVSKMHGKTVFCKQCLVHFTGNKRDVQLLNHKKYCQKDKPVKITVPCDKNDSSQPQILKFTNHHFQDRLPIVAYADFECILKKVKRKKQQSSKFTKVLENHVPMSFCVYLSVDSNLPENISNQLPNEPYLYRGTDSASKFMDYMISMSNLIGDLLDTNLSMDELTQDEMDRFNNCTHCELCNTEFTMTRTPVKDHCHLTGKFRSVLCNKCNLNRKNQRYLPVFIHGSSNYDTHFIIKQLGCDENKISVIPNTKEKYISFTKNTDAGIKIKFLDSYRFLNESLSQLAKILPKDKFKHIELFFDKEDLTLVCRKGIFPYNYVDSWKKLNVKELPSKKRFFNQMTLNHISYDEYNHAKNVWNRFNCQTLGDYSDLYLKTDCLLLCDVFENFRDICLQNYGLDPAHYLTVPSLSFDAMLKYTNVELELLHDYDMYLFIEKGIRGGITSCVKRYATANNQYLKSNYDPKLKNSFLTYIDGNNLYGCAMIKPIPLNSFRWMSQQEILKLDFLSIPDESEIGYIVECDIGYPTYLHDEHKELPFLPETKCPIWSKHTKLLTTLENKSNYVCHYMNLKQALQNNLLLKKVHRVLEFTQSYWLKPYIDFNTEKRKLAVNDFEKNFYKLLNNSLFGKTMENIRKRINLELVNSKNRLNKLISKPNFKNRIIYSENLSGVELSKEILHLNKPIYIGFTVLELSKYHMYDFHYNVIKNFYDNDSINLLYIDTDAFFYEVFTEDLYDDFNNPKVSMYFDMSDYPVEHKCYSIQNKKVLGAFKDECRGELISKFIGLRPKLYAYKINNQDCKKKAKGVSGAVLRKHITFDDYETCLFQKLKIRKEMKSFRSKKHCVQTVSVNKLALNGNDDKRVILEDNINTLPYGHKILRKRKIQVENDEIVCK